MQKEQIYDMMNGFLVEGALSMPEGTGIEDEFAEGKECCLLYDGVYQAGRNLCERLGEDEDNDVDTILSGMERITRLLSLKMYEYGRHEAGLSQGTMLTI
ncbi:MAG: hypothetical protein K2K63_07905 [Acetatifactor sp.]|nr:hypothetical protein [Acetatifactor sp.]